ncbi:four-carbon acid sugar kinase family protein [Sediminibacillus massiliensis]|uniref:four-carbon acid sugar kinase family protein n=1 Tax=Sediminibacillus massiliensis TaxID=1926277 RepID=UPI0009889300|nr:four-carbon acid sugar kinase family protein [Sediminibacillus massiliensis]
MIGVIADDITGSNDIGAMFSKSDYLVDIYSYHPSVGSQITGDKPDVLIFDTDSRLDNADTAYQKVYEATKDIQKAGANQFINKTCSVFRGNIGAEFDAMLDALNEEFAIVVLGFPKNGRTTVNSEHYVYGEKLEDSQFKQDPVHPMNRSNLVEILQSQTKRRVIGIPYPVIKEGAGAIKSRLHQLKKEKSVQYVILDVTEQEDLYEIAQAVHEEKVICGSSALGEEIPKVKDALNKKENNIPLPVNIMEKGIFCAAGSLTPQTSEQIEYMKKTGNTVLELDTAVIIGKENKEETVRKFIRLIVDEMNKGSNVILHSSNTPEKVRITKELGGSRGWTNTEISRFVSETIAGITAGVLEHTGQRLFVVAGGDTSAAVCKMLGIKGMRVWKEIQPGLPSCLSQTDPSYLFVLKSGSFGDRTFLETTFNHLREEAAAHT